MNNQTIIFCDGSSLGNPGPGGWGTIVIFPHPLPTSPSKEGEGKYVQELGGHEDYTTNNKMELTAAISGLACVPDGGEAKVCTDSTYVISGMTKWTHGWKKNGWMTTQKKEVENKGLWLELLRVAGGKRVEWQYVAGHVGIAGNERADEIATSFAQDSEYDSRLYSGSFAEYEIKNILDLTHDTEKKTAKTSSRARSNAKAYSYLSMVDGKIEHHATWAECEKRVKGTKGARYKKALSKQEEEEIIREWKK